MCVGCTIPPRRSIKYNAFKMCYDTIKPDWIICAMLDRKPQAFVISKYDDCQWKLKFFDIQTTRVYRCRAHTINFVWFNICRRSPRYQNVRRLHAFTWTHALLLVFLLLTGIHPDIAVITGVTCIITSAAKC